MSRSVGSNSQKLNPTRSRLYPCELFIRMAVSVVQLAKRAFLTVLLAFAAQYVVPLTVNRDSPDKDVLAAYRRLIKRVHPDKGGRKEDFQKLDAAKDAWEDAVKAINKKAVGSGDRLLGGRRRRGREANTPAALPLSALRQPPASRPPPQQSRPPPGHVGVSL